MARIYSTGFELNSISLEGVNTIGSAPTIATSPVRSGTYACQISGLGSGIAKGRAQPFATANGNGPYFARYYVRITTLPTAENRIISLRNSSNADMVYITLDNNGLLRLYDEDGQIGSASEALSVGGWYCIEIKFDATAAAGSHVVNARLDFVQFAGATNRNLSTGINAMAFGGNLNTEAQTAGQWHFDDLAINDNTGSFQNSYPGSGKIIHLRPNADGDNTAWTNTYTNIDEVTPNGTTDIISSGVSGAIEDENIDDTPSDLDSAATVNLVAVGVQMRETVTTNPDPIIVLRVKASAGGTVEESATVTLTSTTFRINGVVASPNNYLHTLYDLPGASTTPWSKADLDVAQIGVRLTNTPVQADDAEVSALWLLVEYVPSTVLKKVNEIANASIKKINGLTIGNVKTLNGLR